MLRAIAAALVLATPTPSPILKQMSAATFQDAGLAKLSKEELAVLDAWFAEQLSKKAAPTTRSARSSPNAYTIEVVSDNYETLVIDGSVFEAFMGCYGFMAGDEVIFVDGRRPYGCLTANIINLRTGKTCKADCK